MQSNFKVYIIWVTRKIKTLFPLKDKVHHKCCTIYEGLCSCNEKYIGESDRCSHTRVNEHENVNHGSEPSKHIKENPTHKFNWRIIARAPHETSKRKILEALYIRKFNPKLNDKVNSAKLRIFPNGIS